MSVPLSQEAWRQKAKGLNLVDNPSTSIWKWFRRSLWIGKTYSAWAKEFLENNAEIKPFWSNYLGSFDTPGTELTKKGYNGLGTFSLVKYHQLQSQSVHSSDGEAPHKVVFHSPPISSRTRLQTRGVPTTPTRVPVDQDFSQLALSTPGSNSWSPSPALGSGDSPYTEASTLKAIKDEQIVNVALIEYLNALAIHYPNLVADWTLHRFPLIAQNSNREKTYEARIDGYLRRRIDGFPLVILEVKPYTRESKEDDIRMQESAQMAAWINQYPPLPSEIDAMRKNPQILSRRLLVSQDRHNIYLTFAVYNADYVDYICDRAIRDNAFLTMKEYGPFDISQRKAMEMLGELVLAYALQACYSLNKPAAS
ncbi:hypothetical protein F4678DRAFT_480727 [Xylaria arbuscula]|nr:hypothetical protein F4678DRAFT_480727 [Xylaria arbuscula]